MRYALASWVPMYPTIPHMNRHLPAWTGKGGPGRRRRPVEPYLSSVTFLRPAGGILPHPQRGGRPAFTIPRAEPLGEIGLFCGWGIG